MRNRVADSYLSPCVDESDFKLAIRQGESLERKDAPLGRSLISLVRGSPWCYGRREWIGGASGVVDCIPQRGLQSDAGLEEALNGRKSGLAG